MKRSSLLSIAAASLLGSAALMPAVQPAPSETSATQATGAKATQGEAVRRVAQRSLEAAVFGGYRGYRRQRYPNGPGWTHAQVQRMARKRRNQSRNRRAQRRAGSK